MDTKTTVISILVITYLIGMGVKNIDQIENKWIPFIVGMAGAVLGIAGMYVIPDFPASNILDALAVGICSGLASTGADQIRKQVFTRENITEK